MHDIQALCRRVHVIHQGKSLYDGEFEDLVNRVNPKRKLIFEFSSAPSANEIETLSELYSFNIDETILRAELPDQELTQLVSKLFLLGTPASITLEDLPVEDTMRAFFTQPEKFLQ